MKLEQALATAIKGVIDEHEPHVLVLSNLLAAATLATAGSYYPDPESALEAGVGFMKANFFALQQIAPDIPVNLN